MSARILSPSWMVTESERHGIRALEEVLPKVEAYDGRHKHDDDGEYQVRTLDDVLRETSWMRGNLEYEESVEADTLERPAEPEANDSVLDDMQESEVQRQDEGSEDVQSVSEEPPLNNSSPDRMPEPAQGPAGQREDDAPQFEADGLSAKPEEDEEEFGQEMSVDYEDMIRQEAEAVFEEERRRAWASVEEEVTSMRARLAESLRKIETTVREMTETFDDNYLKLLEILVKKIVMRELSISREGIRDIVEETVRMTGNDEPVVVKISPDDYEYLMEYESQWLDSVMHDASMRLEVDEELAPGDCVVESRLGRVDNTVQQRIEKIVEAIYDAADTAQ